MKTNEKLWELASNGELRYSWLNSHISRKYGPDCAMDKSFVPYLVMVFCLAVDLSMFISLFSMLSYDRPELLAVQVAGLAFGFDLIPVYLGIHLRRVRDGLSHDRFLLLLGVMAFAIACGANIFLRLATIDQAAPDLSVGATNLLGQVQETVQDNTVTMTAVAMTVMGIAIPLITSLGSFFTSYMSYNPLRIRQRRCEEHLNCMKDVKRRVQAMLSEFELDKDRGAFLRENDEKKYQAMRDYHRTLVLSYCDYVSAAMKEHLADPASISALTEKDCLRILERLNRELEVFDSESSGTGSGRDRDLSWTESNTVLHMARETVA